MTKKIGIIVSQYNNDITEKLKEGAISRLREQGIQESQLTVFDVPGAIEIPLVAKILAAKNSYAAIICLGAVIRGETSHYDYVCEQVSSGCQQVMMEYTVPVIFGVLTTESIAQAEDRIGGKEGHKGIEAADTALSMIKLMNQLMSYDMT